MSTKSGISLDEFEIIESILYKNGYTFLQEHLKRMHNSANYFGFKFNKEKIEESLGKYMSKLDSNLLYKIRLLLNEKGELFMEHIEIKEDDTPKKMLLSEHKISSNNVFYYHKTTKRTVYNMEYQKFCISGDYFDVIFTNKKGEITEGTISNIFIEKKGRLYTPPIHCGLLNGIMRQEIINKRKAKERVLKIEDLVTADNIYLTNSVRGMMRVQAG